MYKIAYYWILLSHLDVHVPVSVCYHQSAGELCHNQDDFLHASQSPIYLGKTDTPNEKYFLHHINSIQKYNLSKLRNGQHCIRVYKVSFHANPVIPTIRSASNLS